MGFDNYMLYLTSIDKCINEVKNQKYIKFKGIYQLLWFQKDQVSTIFSLIMHNKGILFPLGMEYMGIVNTIKASFNDFNKEDVEESVRCLLNTMHVLGLLELRATNKSYDITPFGMEYWDETTTRIKNNKLLDINY